MTAFVEVKCPKCGSVAAEFVRFMMFNGRLSNVVEVKVWKCLECSRKYLEAVKR